MYLLGADRRPREKFTFFRSLLLDFPCFQSNLKRLKGQIRNSDHNIQGPIQEGDFFGSNPGGTSFYPGGTQVFGSNPGGTSRGYTGFWLKSRGYMYPLDWPCTPCRGYIENTGVESIEHCDRRWISFAECLKWISNGKNPAQNVRPITGSASTRGILRLTDSLLTARSPFEEDWEIRFLRLVAHFYWVCGVPGGRVSV